MLPTYNTDVGFLSQTIESVLDQAYDNWELCMADDASTHDDTVSCLKHYESLDDRIKLIVRNENGHIAEASNSALTICSGEFISLLDHDDLLAPEALYFVVETLNDKEWDLIYSDEDKVEDKTLGHPYFKPDWSPDTFLTRNYIGHFVTIRKTLIDLVGGFNPELTGSQDYDLLLKVTEQTDKICHIPKILYHWRMHDESTSKNTDSKSYAFDNGQKALNQAFERRKIEASASPIPNQPGYYAINYAIKKADKVSILIPTKDKTEVIKVCIDSIIELTSYSNYEIIVIDNNSSEAEFFELMDHYKNLLQDRFQVVSVTEPFNFSLLTNRGAAASTGEYLLLLNNDTEVTTADWLNQMIQHCQRTEIGAVGVKLLYHNDTVQHAGVVIGLGEIAAGHTFVGADASEAGYYNYLNTAVNYSAVTAACLMVRKSVYNEVGGFYEDLTIEYNDIDFCLKVLEKGYRNIYLSDVVLYHYESLSRGHPMANRSSYQRHKREVNLFQSRWKKYMDHDPCYNPNLSRIYTHFDLNIND